MSTEKYVELGVSTDRVMRMFNELKLMIEENGRRINRLEREIRIVKALSWLRIPTGIPHEESDEEFDLVGLPQPASVTGFGTVKRGVNIESK